MGIILDQHILLKHRQQISKKMLDAVTDTIAYQTKFIEDRKERLPPELVQRLEKIHSRIPRDIHQINPFILEEHPLYKLFKERYDEQQQLKLMKYMSRVQDEASRKMLDDEEFANQFLEKDEFNAVILSIDIRRSTELMLKAKSPQFYAEFINTLLDELIESVKSNFGIYDKFTGDGFLAFFPDFYSGEEAILHALLCADECREIFDAVFSAYKNDFDIDPEITGIGAGIDTGSVFKSGLEMEYTVVGKPVVYACRLSAAPAGHTYLTTAADHCLKDTGCEAFFSKKTLCEIKHEGSVSVYDVLPVTEHAVLSLQPKLPSWAAEIKED